MKKVSLLLIFLFLISCSEKKNKNLYEIKGTIKGLKDSAKIMLLDFSKYQMVDSTFSINEKFNFKRNFEEPFEATLYIFENEDNLEEMPKKIRFWTNNTNLDITVDFDSLKRETLLNSSNIKNSKINELFFEKESAFQDKWKKYMALLDATESKEKRDSINNIFNINRKKDAISFAYQNSDSYLALDQIIIYREEVSKDKLDNFYNALSKNLKNTQKGLFLKTYLEEEKVEIGRPFIDFTANDLKGNTINLSYFKGKIIVLDFWDRYCPPCRTMNLEELSVLYEKYKNEVTFISFSLDKAKENWVTASKEDNIKWLNISDLKGFDSKVVASYKINLRPKTFIIDKKGMIKHIFSGYEKGEIEPELKKLIQ